MAQHETAALKLLAEHPTPTPKIKTPDVPQNGLYGKTLI
jgi:hypothetical protein